MSSEYDNTETGPIGAPAYSAAPERGEAVAADTSADEADTPADTPVGGSSGVSWPTVLVAGGVSAIVSALIVTIGVVGLLLSDVGQGTSASSAQPTVVNLGSAQGQMPQQAPTAGAPASSAPPAAAPANPSIAAGPKGEVLGPPGEGSSADLPTGGGASGGGLAPGTVPEAAAPQTTQPTTEQTTQATTASRATPTVGQLQNDLDVLVGGGSNAQKAKRLEGGQRAVNQAQPIVLLLQRFKPLGFSYNVVGPVTVTGNTAKATLELKSPGYQPATMPVYWVWQDGQWKLSNRSICDIGSYAQIPCSL
ncbi:hypothetical protein GIY30_11670 [Gordonia sp. HNM0687]|uniref:Low molecular weight antigen MTB12-like C-terminal domain-containing protein n=1 Tax=Gordonia mangrovi TaxID=2665643 RepID=A0A6L7GQ49_9ACTN|nr:hypothetical protein [Gordonia mangrovi]MXP22006.1 hypothetical protein [Gordonia mangrovi]UVF76360.1 hypothetical protein NWF22_13290 [Gordonia mangrovi]